VVQLHHTASLPADSALHERVIMFLVVHFFLS
jgi:hypothetical protein